MSGKNIIEKCENNSLFLKNLHELCKEEEDKNGKTLKWKMFLKFWKMWSKILKRMRNNLISSMINEKQLAIDEKMT